MFDKVKLGTISYPRNPIIFDLFYRAGLVEKVGSGINRVKKIMNEAELEIKYEVDDFFKVIIYRKSELLNEPLNESLNEPLKRLYHFIISVSKVNRVKIMVELGLSRASAARYLSELQKKGLIEYVGSKKTGYYRRKD